MSQTFVGLSIWHIIYTDCAIEAAVANVNGIPFPVTQEAISFSNNPEVCMAAVFACGSEVLIIRDFE
jgi:hypothetical protein